MKSATLNFLQDVPGLGEGKVLFISNHVVSYFVGIYIAKTFSITSYVVLFFPSYYDEVLNQKLKKYIFFNQLKLELV